MAYLKKNWSILFGVIVALSSSVQAQNLEKFEENVTEFTLDNGLHFIVVERPVAPVASFVTFVDVGGADEPAGQTGIAHIFEHMVFKGSKTVGTTNWEEEQEVIDQTDAAYSAWVEEKNSPYPEEEKMAEYWADFEKYQEKANSYVITNQFDEIISREGATHLNARTSYDFTDYFYSLLKTGQSSGSALNRTVFRIRFSGNSMKRKMSLWKSEECESIRIRSAGYLRNFWGLHTRPTPMDGLW